MGRVEQSGAPPWVWIGAFLGIIALRNLLELFSAENPIYGPAQFFLHYPLAYAAPFLALALLLSIGSGEPISSVSRLMVVAWFLTLLPPLLRLPGEPTAENIIFYGISLDRLGYSMPMEGADYLDRILFFFSPWHKFSGTTAGIRIETFLACLLSLVFVRLKRKGWIRALGTFGAVYLTALIFFHLPMLFYSAGALLFPGLGFSEFFWGEGILPRVETAERHVRILVFYLTGICTLLGAGWGLRWSRGRFLQTARRHAGFPVSLLLFSGLTGLLVGQYLRDPVPGLRVPVPYDGFAVLSILFSLLAVALTFPAGEESRVPSRSPGTFAAGSIDGGWRLAVGMAAILFAWVGGYSCMAVVITLLACRFLGSVSPFHLANHPGLAAVFWTLCALLGAAAGLALFLGREAVPLFPRELVAVAALSYLPALLAADLVSLESPLRIPSFLLAALSPISLVLVLGLSTKWVAGSVLAALLFGWLPTRLPDRLQRSFLATAPALLTVILILSAGSSFLPGLRERVYRSARYHARMAKELEQKGNLSATLSERRMVLEISPADPSAHYNLGVLLNSLGNLHQAAASFRESVRLDPHFAEAWENLGKIEAALGKVVEARDAFHRAIDAWELRISADRLPAAGRRRARQRIQFLRSLAAQGIDPDQGPM